MKKSVLLAVAFTCGLYAQGRGGGPVTLNADLNRAYNGIKTNLTKAAEDMPEDGYSLQPSKKSEISARGSLTWPTHRREPAPQSPESARISARRQRLPKRTLLPL